MTLKCRQSAYQSNAKRQRKESEEDTQTRCSGKELFDNCCFRTQSTEGDLSATTNVSCVRLF